MIAECFLEVLSSVFNLKLSEQLAPERRGFCAFHVPARGGKLRLLLHLNLGKDDAVRLMADVEKKGLPPAVGGYYTPSLVSKPPFNHDMLFVTDAWLALDEKNRLGTVYHEACHCFRESKNFKTIPVDSLSFRRGQNVRALTRYHDGDGMGHDDQWFALIVDAAGAMHTKYAQQFATTRELVEAALSADFQLDQDEPVPDWENVEVAHD